MTNQYRRLHQGNLPIERMGDTQYTELPRQEGWWDCLAKPQETSSSSTPQARVFRGEGVKQ